MEIRRISASDTLSIRNEVLRPKSSIGDCVFENDERGQTFHLGAFIDGQLVSVASFFYLSNEELPYENQYQLRGMATLPDFRAQGLSSELLKVAFPIIKQNFCDVVWCNAREGAVGFYEKVGFEKSSDKFEIKGIGPHFMMHKKI